MQAMWYSRYSKCVSLSRLNGISDFRAQHDCLPYAHAKVLVLVAGPGQLDSFSGSHHQSCT